MWQERSPPPSLAPLPQVIQGQLGWGSCLGSHCQWIFFRGGITGAGRLSGCVEGFLTFSTVSVKPRSRHALFSSQRAWPSQIGTLARHSSSLRFHHWDPRSYWAAASGWQLGQGVAGDELRHGWGGQPTGWIRSCGGGNSGLVWIKLWVHSGHGLYKKTGNRMKYSAGVLLLSH